METLTIQTSQRAEMRDITDIVQAAVTQSKIQDGICVVFCPHTTAGLTINENADPSVQQDIVHTLDQLIPEDSGYRHSEGNADSHIKSSLFGSSLNIFVEHARLVLGRWQGIYFCESDGPRKREVWIKLVSDRGVKTV